MSSGSRYAARAARERREKLEGGILKGGTEKRLGEDACKLRVRPVCRGAYNSRECGKGYYWIKIEDCRVKTVSKKKRLNA